VREQFRFFLSFLTAGAGRARNKSLIFYDYV
jgi:hypothetical protein